MRLRSILLLNKRFYLSALLLLCTIILLDHHKVIATDNGDLSALAREIGVYSHRMPHKERFSDLYAKLPGPPAAKPSDQAPEILPSPKGNNYPKAPKSSSTLINVRDYGVGLAGLKAALATVAHAERTLYFPPGVYNIDENLTIPANINLRFERGSLVTIQKGVTLSINGSMDNCLFQIFSDANTDPTKGVQFGKGNVSSVLPEWWGAKGDGDKRNAETNSLAIQKAINSNYQFKGVVLFAKGVYYINRTIILRGSTYLIGQGIARDLKGGTILILMHNTNVNMVEDHPQDARGESGGIRDILFCGGSQTATCHGIYFHNQTRQWRIQNCCFYSFIGSPDSYAIYLQSVGRTHLENNYIEVCSNDMYLFVFDSWIMNNEAHGSLPTSIGIALKGGGNVINGNILYGCFNGIKIIDGANGNRIIGNRIDDLTGNGIQATGAFFTNNSVIGNEIGLCKLNGILFNKASRNIILGNYIFSNKNYGIKLEHSNSDNVINNNIFVDNTLGHIINEWSLIGNYNGGLVENNIGIDVGSVPFLPEGNSPNVSIAKLFKTANKKSTVIDNFLCGTLGKSVTVIINDPNTEISRWSQDSGSYIFTANSSTGKGQPSTWSGNLARQTAWNYFPERAASGDCIYWGNSFHKFAGVKVYPGESFQAASVDYVWEYFNGSHWTPLKVSKNDIFASSDSSQESFFVPPTDWALINLNNALPGLSAPKISAYWIRCRINSVKAGQKGGRNAKESGKLSFIRLTTDSFGPMPAGKMGILNLEYDGVWHERSRSLN